MILPLPFVGGRKISIRLMQLHIIIHILTYTFPCHPFLHYSYLHARCKNARLQGSADAIDEHRKKMTSYLVDSRKVAIFADE